MQWAHAGGWVFDAFSLGTGCCCCACACDCGVDDSASATGLCTLAYCGKLEIGIEKCRVRIWSDGDSVFGVEVSPATSGCVSAGELSAAGFDIVGYFNSQSFDDIW